MSLLNEIYKKQYEQSLQKNKKNKKKRKLEAIEHIDRVLKKYKDDILGASGNKRPRISSENSEILELEESDASPESKQRMFPIDDLEFFILNANGNYVPCKQSEKANAIEKDGIIYKQIGRDFKRTFASLTCLFIRMREGVKAYWTPTARIKKGRSIVQITDDNGNRLTSQALKFASLAWGKLTPAAKLATADMPLRGFGHAFPVDHTDNDKTNNDVSNGMIMTKAEHHGKTTLSAETRANRAMSRSTPCTMTVFDLEGKPLLDSEDKPIIKNYPHRKQAMIDYKVKSIHIYNSIATKDKTWNSLVKIKYEGRDCLAQFSWYNLPDLVGEKWKPVTEDDHKTLNVPLSDQTEYWVSNMSRFKFVTKSSKNAKITNYQEKVRPRITLMNKHLFFYRIVALVFDRDQLNAKIAELKIAKQKNKFGEDYTFATLEVDHIDFDPTNHYANNLQFMIHKENIERSHCRPCRIWERGKEDAKKEYPSVVAAAKAIGYKSVNTVHDILKNTKDGKNTKNKWRGEYRIKIIVQKNENM